MLAPKVLYIVLILFKSVTMNVFLNIMLSFNVWDNMAMGSPPVFFCTCGKIAIYNISPKWSEQKNSKSFENRTQMVIA